MKNSTVPKKERNMLLAGRIKEIRKEHKLKRQEDLAVALTAIGFDYSTQNIQMYEKGSEPKAKFYYALYKFDNYSPLYVMGYTTNKRVHEVEQSMEEMMELISQLQKEVNELKKETSDLKTENQQKERSAIISAMKLLEKTFLKNSGDDDEEKKNPAKWILKGVYEDRELEKYFH